MCRLRLLRGIRHDARFINHETNTADKCTFCAYRLEAGLPACAESCRRGAHHRWRRNDPKSRISRLLREHELALKVLARGQYPAAGLLSGMDEAREVDGNPPCAPPADEMQRAR